MPHPFDRYASFTDLRALMEATEKPLRKSVRVNTMKCSVEDFETWARQKGWTLAPVPWCAEAFFLERENRETALGRDLRHLLGHFYMQEAASMLPPALLNPKPGEAVLDLCAAPGSKTTQIAAMVSASPPIPLSPPPARLPGEGAHLISANGLASRDNAPPSPGGQPWSGAERGVRGGEVIANDVQEKRLWVLNDAVQRTGAANVVIVRKVGQWYAGHMTERFDRVLCDAPCTAQGTARKDSDALQYCSPESIAKMARLQHELLESAIHACKVGGRIVYSTCTLTLEENESVVLDLLSKFSDQLEVVSPRAALPSNLPWDMSSAISDSELVQQWLKEQNNFPLSPFPFPLLRLWPQTFDTEGFFCAVLRKVKTTRFPQRTEAVKRQAQELTRSKRISLEKFCRETYGTDFLKPGETLVERGQQVLLVAEAALAFPLPVAEYAMGVPFAKILSEGRFRITNDLASLRGTMALSGYLELSDEQLSGLLAGHDVPCDASLHGDVILRHAGIAVGLSLAKGGVLLNRLPRWVVKNTRA